MSDKSKKTEAKQEKPVLPKPPMCTIELGHQSPSDKNKKKK